MSGGSTTGHECAAYLQADHVSGLPHLVERTGATACLPEGSGVEFEHRALADGEMVRLGNTELRAVATPGHAPAHHAYLTTDHARSPPPPSTSRDPEPERTFNPLIDLRAVGLGEAAGDHYLRLASERLRELWLNEKPLRRHMRFVRGHNRC